jgi:hypothetical protein
MLGDLAEAGGGRNADLFAQVVEAFEYPKADACFKSLQLARPLECLMAAGGDGPSLIIDLILCERGCRNENAIRLRKLQQTIPRALIPVSLSSDPRNEEHGQIVPTGQRCPG